MDQIKTGALIRTLRLNRHMTQLELANCMGISDKAISKWERGCGAPDIALLPALAQALNVEIQALLDGCLPQNDQSNGNMQKTKCYVCPACGNVLLASNAAQISCCGQVLRQLAIQQPDAAHGLSVTKSDGAWYVSSAHPMQRGHAIAFVALLTGDMVVMKRLYPEWGMEAHLPCAGHGTLLWYCTQHGLFSQKI